MKITLDKKKQFDYLNTLRKCGVTNMFGAAPYLAREFEINMSTAKKVLTEWMENFNEEGYEHLLESNGEG